MADASQIVTGIAPSPTGHDAYRHRAHAALQLALRPRTAWASSSCARGHRRAALHPPRRRRRSSTERWLGLDCGRRAAQPGFEARLPRHADSGASDAG